MGRLKTLWSIGVILGLSAPAVAADFSPPPPPPPGPIASELGSGWYLRGDVGWVEFSDPGKLPLGAGLPFDRVGLRETWSVGGGEKSAATAGAGRPRMTPIDHRVFSLPMTATSQEL